MLKFSWKDRDTAAYDMLQLVYHGPEHIRLSALQALQAIRSPKSIAELKAIALDVNWPFDERREALCALAAFPDEIYLPELAPLLKDYWDERWKAVEAAWNSSLDPVIDHQLTAEGNLAGTMLKTMSVHPSNHGWFFDLLEQIDPPTRIELLSHAISAACESPLEPILVDRLTGLLDQYPALFTIKTAEVIATHGNTKSDQWLTQQADKVIAFSASANSLHLSSLLSWTNDLTAAVIQKKPELARFSPSSPDYNPQLPEGATLGSTNWKADCDFTASPIGGQIHQLYTRAASGDEAAFASLYVLSDDYRVSLPVQAVVTHFLGQLWPHERVLEQLCLLVQNAETSGKPWDYMPVRLEAAEALRNTGTSAAWEALSDVLFLSAREKSAYIDWLTDLTDVLSNTPSIRKAGNLDVHAPGQFRKVSNSDPATRKDWVWTVEGRPWFQCLDDMTDDLNAILRDQ